MDGGWWLIPLVAIVPSFIWPIWPVLGDGYSPRWPSNSTLGMWSYVGGGGGQIIRREEGVGGGGGALRKAVIHSE